MKLTSNDFELFGVPMRFAQDRTELDARWKQLQSATHPDKFAAEGAAAQRVAMQWAVRVNEAYQRLKDPNRRAAYLCELHGVRVDAHDNTAMPRDFLTQQMQWREALEEAKSAETVESLADDVGMEKSVMLRELAELIDERADWSAAAAQVRALMFIERFSQDVDRRLEALEQ